jgi:predicted metal-dependent peptidase
MSRVRREDSLSGKVVEARIKLMLRHPYLAAAVARYPLVDSTRSGWCDTMATDGYFIHINTEFCERLTLEETMFVLAHELMHCLLGHIDRRGDREPDRWNRAIDYATNLMLKQFGLKMPENGLINDGFSLFTSERIYEILSQQEQSGKEGRRPIAGFDLHLGPDDIRGMGAHSKEFPTADERRRLRISLSSEVRRELPGDLAGLFRSEVERSGKPSVSWKELLARFFQGLRQDDYRLFPPNRKHIWRGLYLPAMGAPGPDHIVVAIDTSGSMSDGILAQVLTELDRLRSMTSCRLTILQCDADIQDVSEYEPYEWIDFERIEMKGRGGTDLNPPFEWLFDAMRTRGVRPDALIYLTDGWGNDPDSEPPFPVVWIVPEGCRDSFPFGTLILMAAAPS